MMPVRSIGENGAAADAAIDATGDVQVRVQERRVGEDRNRWHTQASGASHARLPHVPTNMPRPGDDARLHGEICPRVEPAADD